MSLKVAFIGAGSVGFTQKLVRDLLAVPEFVDTTFALHDISKLNLDMIAQILRKDIKANGLPAKVTTSLQRKRALENANYVINCTRIGGLEAFATDVEIPLKYGIDQCVGDTLCAGGIMYGQRNIPQMLAFTADALEVGADGCMLLNYANPMAMNTWAALDAYDRGEGVFTVGLCHGVQGGHRQIANVIERVVNGRKRPGSKGYRTVSKQDVDIICAGINHQTWYIKVQFEGEDWTDRLRQGFEQHPHFSKTEKVRIDVLRRFGYYSTESNGHLSEYVPWYRKRPKEIRRWVSLDNWIHGETAGYLRYCLQNRHWFKTEFPQKLADAGKPITADQRSEEHGSYIIEAIETGRTYRGHFNVRNNGAISNLPDDCIVEVPGYVDRHGISIPRVGELPAACAATCQASVNVQRMSKDAAVAGDVILLKQAMLHDPLTGAVLNPEDIWQMTDEMLIAQSKWLPNYPRKMITQAKQRLDKATRNGTRVKTKTWRGAARRAK